MQSGYEQGNQPGSQIVFDLSHLKDRLGAGLSRLKNPVAERLLQTISEEVNPLVIDVQEGVELAKLGLNEVVDEAAGEAKKLYIGEVQTEYSTLVAADPRMTSPRQFAKKHELDGKQRTCLKEEYESGIKTSRVALQKAVMSDAKHLELELPVTEEALGQTFQNIGEQTQATIETLVAEIETQLPKRGIKRLASLALGKADHDKGIDTPLDTNLAQLEQAIDFVRGGAVNLPETTARVHEETVRDNVTALLRAHFGDLSDASIQYLGSKLKLAYEDIRLNRPVHESIRELRDLEVIQKDIDDIEEPVPNEDLEVGETILGSLESPFPWLPDEKVNVSLIRSNGHALLFSEAMTSGARELSKKLRVETESGRKFPSFIERIKEIELTGNALSHPWVKGARGIDFHGLTICYFTNNRANGGRIYYARTDLKRYPEVAKLTEAHGLDPNTPYVILLAETDKANQLKVFSDFGVGRRSARAGKAGAI